MTIFDDGFVAFQLDFIELFEIEEFVVIRKIFNKILHMNGYFVESNLYIVSISAEWEYIKISNNIKALKIKQPI